MGAFNKDANILYGSRDQMQGEQPISFIQKTNPILILDEPQNMETPIRRKAIENLHPACTLRFSATHKHIYNLVYKLGPVPAYDLGLVKQIEVDSITTEKDFYRSRELITATLNPLILAARLRVVSGEEILTDRLFRLLGVKS